MKIAMLSPYSLSRPGGVQGQVLGLARALRSTGPRGDGGRSRRAGENEPAGLGGGVGLVEGPTNPTCS